MSTIGRSEVGKFMLILELAAIIHFNEAVVCWRGGIFRCIRRAR